MRVFVYSDIPGLGPNSETACRAASIIQSVTDRSSTDHRNLVVALYLVPERIGWCGCLVSTRCVDRERADWAGGKWRFVRRFPLPDGLPAEFPLIRLAFDEEWLRKGQRVLDDA